MPESNLSRRQLFQRGAIGLASASALATGGGWLLRADAQPTESSGDLGAYGDYLRDTEPAAPVRQADAQLPQPQGDWQPTEDNILGPYYRKGAAFRAKVTPPLEPGDVLFVTGRVWAADTRKPLANTLIDIWQANQEGKYDNQLPAHPHTRHGYTCRCRLLTDAEGWYEYETIMPGRYALGRGQQRPAHIHYWIRVRGYEELVTQLYFAGDPHNDTDPFIKKSLIVTPQQVKTPNGNYQHATFDIVLAKEK
jgi:protocatechuate 3,4-dioxygenase beta subunit